MQHALCRLEDYLDDVAYASASAERRRFFENLSELARHLSVLFLGRKCLKIRHAQRLAEKSPDQASFRSTHSSFDAVPISKLEYGAISWCL